jgi:hypothetical protein
MTLKTAVWLQFILHLNKIVTHRTSNSFILSILFGSQLFIRRFFV